MHYYTKFVLVFFALAAILMVFTQAYEENAKPMCVFLIEVDRGRVGQQQQQHHCRIFSSKSITLNYLELLYNGIITVATLLPINHL